MEVWGPFDWLAFALVAVPAVQMAIDKWMEQKNKAPELRESALWNRAPVICICGAVVLAALDHFGAFEHVKAHHSRVEIGAGAEIRGPITIYDEAGRVFFSVPENGEMAAPPR